MMKLAGFKMYFRRGSFLTIWSTKPSSQRALSMQRIWVELMAEVKFWVSNLFVTYEETLFVISACILFNLPKKDA